MGHGIGHGVTTMHIWPGMSLCVTCVHGREIRTERSRFLLCELSASDHNFPKYPPQPVGRCGGYVRKGEPEDRTGGNDVVT